MAGGGHEAQGFNFTLPHDVAENANAQGSWRYCQNCHTMFYDGFTAKGLCVGHKEHGPQVGDRERFIMAQIPPGNQIALLSWQGLFSAQDGGGGDVYANRVQVGPWETWNVIDNHDGTLSFQTTNGHLLTATNGGQRQLLLDDPNHGRSLGAIR